MKHPDSIWCEIWLDELAEVVDGYEPWKDGPWYHAVNWGPVNSLFADVIRRTPVGVEFDIDGAAQGLATVDREGLYSLFVEPVGISVKQVTNGGHRARAMRQQGVTRVPGMFYVGDVGESIAPAQVYLRPGITGLLPLRH